MKVDKVIQTINEYHMTAGNQNVVVGLSGGADSVCLLHVLCSLKERLELNVFACHLNHMLRGEEADRDEEFCEELCRNLGIPLDVSRINVSDEAKKRKKSFELCAREIRYKFFKDCADKHNAVVATAHTMSDSMETVLFNMMRGTALKGLCGIPLKRDNIIRPLISLTREEVEEYCKEHNLSYVTDSTNQSDDYARNYIRHNILPLLKENSGNFASAFWHMTTALSRDDDYLEDQTHMLLENAQTDSGYSADMLSKTHPSLLFRAITCLVKERQIPADFDKISLIADMILAGEGRIRLSENEYAVVKNGIFFFEKPSVLQPYFEVELKNNEAILPFDNKKVLLYEENKEKLLIFREFPAKDLKNHLDYGKIDGKLFARQRKDGDEVELYKRKCHKSLKKLFNEAKVSLEQRAKAVVISDDSGIVWVEGFGVAQRCCVDENTAVVCEIKIVT